jgi:hypothetical protein
MTWTDLPRRLAEKLMGITTIDVEAAHLESRHGELTLLTETSVFAGRKVRITFPDGDSVLGAVSWLRSRNADGQSQPAKLVGLKLTQPPPSLPAAAEPPPWSLRKAPRTPCRQWVRFESGPRLGTTTVDLSLEGCRIEADLERHLGETFRIVLELPGTARSIRAQAKVLWSRQGQSGLRFLNMHVDDEAALAKALGLPTWRAQDQWSKLWKRSLEGLAYRLTPSADGQALLDLEVPNWLASFELGSWQATGEWAGTFATVEVSHRTPETVGLQQQQGLLLEGAGQPIHLKLRDADGRLKLAIWGWEQSFRRVPRTPLATEC